MADLPGLIEGAHLNRGLGHSFLRHVERVQGLVFVVDAAGSERRSPVDDLRQLLEELELYQPGLSKTPSLVLANKCDLPSAQAHLPALRRFVATQQAKAKAEAERGAGPSAAQLARKVPLRTLRDKNLAGPDPTRSGPDSGAGAGEAGEADKAAVALVLPRGILGIYETSMATGKGLEEAVIAIRARLLS